MKIKNLGAINQAEISIGDMSIFFGKNGTGKTYTAYAIFGIIDFLRQKKINFFKNKTKHFDEILENKETIFELDELNNIKNEYLQEELQSKLPMILKNTFSGTKYTDTDTATDIKVSKEELDYFVSMANFEKQMVKRFDSIKIKNIQGFEDGLYQLTISVSNSKATVLIQKYKSPESDNERNTFDLDFDLELSELLNNEEYVEFTDKRHLLNYVSEKLTSYIFRKINPIYIPAERIGINVFKKEVEQRRLSVYEDLSEEAKNKKKVKTSGLSLYPTPISSYMRNLNRWSEIYSILQRHDPFRNRSHSNNLYMSEAKNILESELVKGSFNIDDNDEIFYKMSNTETPIPLSISSSTVKSLVSLQFYLSNLAINLRMFKYDIKKDFMIIDEPELNLHPQAQRKMAKMLFMLMKQGMSIMISTHSDYFIREIINLEYQEKINKEKGDSHNQYSVRGYDFKENTAKVYEDLTEAPYLSNFDSASENIEDKYYELLDQYRELQESKGLKKGESGE